MGGAAVKGSQIQEGGTAAGKLAVPPGLAQARVKGALYGPGVTDGAFVATGTGSARQSSERPGRPYHLAGALREVGAAATHLSVSCNIDAAVSRTGDGDVDQVVMGQPGLRGICAWLADPCRIQLGTQARYGSTAAQLGVLLGLGHARVRP